VRIDQYIPTFPHLRLSACTQLVNDLELSATSRLDFWQGEWVTVDLESVLPVEKGQRVILKIRPSLRQELKNSECPGLNKELDLQPRKFRVSKRCAEDELVSPIKKAPRTTQTTSLSVHTTGTPVEPSLKSTYIPSDATALKDDKNPVPSHTTTTVPRVSSHSSAAPPPSLQPPRDPDVKARCWPYEFYVCEVRDGLLRMSKLLGNAFSRRRHKNNRFNKREAFVKSFPGVKYVKTTVWKYSKIWEESDEATRELFTRLGKTENAYFEHFLAALDNPHLLPSASSDESDSQLSDSKSNHEDEGTTSDPLPAHNVPSYSQALDKGKAREDPEPRLIAPLPSRRIWPPINIDFDRLRYRVTELRDSLEEILFEPVESEFFRSSVISFEAGSSGAKNTVFVNGSAG
jgi:hypothetical protein